MILVVSLKGDFCAYFHAIPICQCLPLENVLSARIFLLITKDEKHMDTWQLNINLKFVCLMEVILLFTMIYLWWVSMMLAKANTTLIVVLLHISVIKYSD